MIAPFLIFGIRKNNWFGGLSICAGLILIGSFGTNLSDWNRSFHMGNAMHFLTGIGSYFLWKRLPQSQYNVLAKLLFWGVILGACVALKLPYKIWFATMALILYDRVHRRPLFFLEWPRGLLLSRPLQFLGRTSYVTYLLHWIVIEVVLFWLIQSLPGWNDRILLATVCTTTVFPITYVASGVIHRYFELPMTELSKRRTTLLRRTPVGSPV